MTLTYKLDLDILPLDLNAKNQDCLFVRLPARVVTDTHTDTQTHDVKTITPITSETWGLKTESFSNDVYIMQILHIQTYMGTG